MPVTKLNQIYKCSICGNIIEITHVGGGTLVCCGKEMDLQLEKKQEEGKEKHIPIIEKTPTGYKITVSSIQHPMTVEHSIEWIELITDTKVYRQYLKPTNSPTATFECSDENVSARSYCNLHGLWKS